MKMTFDMLFRLAIIRAEQKGRLNIPMNKKTLRCIIFLTAVEVLNKFTTFERNKKAIQKRWNSVKNKKVRI